MCIEADSVSVQYFVMYIFDFNIKVQFLIYPKRQFHILLSFFYVERVILLLLLLLFVIYRGEAVSWSDISAGASLLKGI